MYYVKAFTRYVLWPVAVMLALGIVMIGIAYLLK